MYVGVVKISRHVIVFKLFKLQLKHSKKETPVLGNATPVSGMKLKRG